MTSEPVITTAEAEVAEKSVAEAPMFTINRVKTGESSGEKICKSQAVTSSRFKRKLCATQEE
ncbi:MAG: hypothetical protein ABJO36_02260 [Litorimonas sp.]